MNGVAYEHRRRIADAVRAQRGRAAEYVTQEFLERHPDWQEKYGGAARVRGIEDAEFHVDFLAGAIESGSIEAFEQYARWTARVLGSRGIDARFLIENLMQLSGWFDSSLEDGSDVVRQYIDAACSAARQPSPAGGEMDPDRSLYLQAILAGQRTPALKVALEALRSGMGVIDIYTDLLQPAQYELGRLWETNQITVAREHMATAVTQYVVAQLYSRFDMPLTQRGRIIVTGVQGEMHQLGANMLSDVLESEGWDVRFLGTQLPHRDILAAIDDHQPRIVGISTTMLFNIPRVSELVDDVRARFGDVLIIVGGGAFRAAPDLWRDIGADGFGQDLREGVALVDRLAGAAA